ncbi:hypothetical protein SNEBB_005904 [Seison nebaliae]|nr:hypothetical protein SNEBB_005904 [Seison nebaliae]
MNLYQTVENPILLLGAGGLGCQVLNSLASLQCRNIHVIDMDTIEITNLNRQFLFDEEDIGESKAVICAKKIHESFPKCQITPHFKQIEEFSREFYKKFDVVICGLDSVSARRWINSTLISLVEYDDNKAVIKSSIIPLIDGGTEAYDGNVRVIIPTITACIECSLDLFPSKKTFPLCTIANRPRNAEHCIEYVKLILWNKEQPFGNIELDIDDVDHLEWIENEARKRAESFHIKGVNSHLTKTVLRNILPAIATTNSFIANVCAIECYKLLKKMDNIDNWLQINNVDQFYLYVWKYDKEDDCLVCGEQISYMNADLHWTLQELIDHMKTNDKLNLSDPSLTTKTTRKDVENSHQTLYMKRPIFLRRATEANLSKTLNQLKVTEDNILYITDDSISGTLQLQLKFNCFD